MTHATHSYAGARAKWAKRTGFPAFFFGARYPMIKHPCAKLQDRRGVSHFFSVRYDHHFKLRNYA